MWIAVVVQHPSWFLQTPQCDEEFDPLIPRDRPVFVVVQDQQRCVDFVSKKQGRIGDVFLSRGPQVFADSALSPLVLKHSTHPAAPANATVGAGHVAHRSSGFGTCEAIGLCDQVSRLVSAPTVPLHANPIFIHEALGNQVVHARKD